MRRADLASPRATAALALLAFALRFAWGLATGAPAAWDGVLYERGARALASGLGYSCFMFGPQADPRVATAYYPVGYPAFLGALYALLGAAPWVVALGGSLAGAGTVALAHRLSLRVAGPRAALLAALGLALMPGQVLTAPTPMTETLWGFTLALAVYALARRDRPSRGDLVLAAVALAASVYVRPQALPLAALLPLVPRGTVRERALRAAGVTAAVLALVAPWTLRNCRAIDGCVLVSANGGANLAIGALPAADGTYRFPTAADGCRGVVGEAARDRCWRRVAWGHVRARPWRWLRRAAPKLEHTLGYEAAPVEYLAAARPALVTPARRARWTAALTATWRAALGLALLALAPLYPRRPLGPAGRLAAAAALTVAGMHAVFFGGDRYHLPLAGLVAVVASGALRDAPRWLRGERRLRAQRPFAGGDP